LIIETLPTSVLVEAVYLSPNTSLIQPMDLGVINFMTYYLHCIFRQLAEGTYGEDR